MPREWWSLVTITPRFGMFWDSKDLATACIIQGVLSLLLHCVMARQRSCLDMFVVIFLDSSFLYWFRGGF